MKKRPKNRYHGSIEYWKFLHKNSCHVLNLLALHRWQREHPRQIVQTDRYRDWLAKRDAP